MIKGHTRLNKFEIDHVLRKVGSGNPPKVFGGYKTKMSSIRLQVFKEKGIKCVSCGIEGAFIAQERCKDTEKPHFNLYAIASNGKSETLMTVDHILPASYGGKRSLDNLQPMCCICNQKKGNSRVTQLAFQF